MTIVSGKRKKAIAQVKLISPEQAKLLNKEEGNGTIFINDKSANSYLQNNPQLFFSIQKPILALDLKTEINLKIKVSGGGLRAQSEAIQLALSKFLCTLDPTYRSILKSNGFLSRDSRCKERKKYGLKKARKASQFSKR
jgi:small subunit ribosomal protein S9